MKFLTKSDNGMLKGGFCYSNGRPLDNEVKQGELDFIEVLHKAIIERKVFTLPSNRRGEDALFTMTEDPVHRESMIRPPFNPE